MWWGGEILNLNNYVYFKMKVGLGRGTNNFAELNSLRHLLLFAWEKNCHRIQFFEDTQLIINWINGIYLCHFHTLTDLLEDALYLKSRFEFFVCSHIYKERNEVVDILTKEAVQLIRRNQLIHEYLDGFSSRSTIGRSLKDKETTWDDLWDHSFFLFADTSF